MTFPRCVYPFPAFSYVRWTCKSKESQWNHTWAARGCLTREDRAVLRFPETKLWSQFMILWLQLKFCIPASWALWLPWGESRAPGWGVTNKGFIYPLGGMFLQRATHMGAPVGPKSEWQWPSSASLSRFGGAWKLSFLPPPPPPHFVILQPPFKFNGTVSTWSFSTKESLKQNLSLFLQCCVITPSARSSLISWDVGSTPWTNTSVQFSVCLNWKWRFSFSGQEIPYLIQCSFFKDPESSQSFGRLRPCVSFRSLLASRC